LLLRLAPLLLLLLKLLLLLLKEKLALLLLLKEKIAVLLLLLHLVLDSKFYNIKFTCWKVYIQEVITNLEEVIF
jgi:hypothetical protein